MRNHSKAAALSLLIPSSLFAGPSASCKPSARSATWQAVQRVVVAHTLPVPEFLEDGSAALFFESNSGIRRLALDGRSSESESVLIRKRRIFPDGTRIRGPGKGDPIELSSGGLSFEAIVARRGRGVQLRWRLGKKRWTDWKRVKGSEKASAAVGLALDPKHKQLAVAWAEGYVSVRGFRMKYGASVGRFPDGALPTPPKPLQSELCQSFVRCCDALAEWQQTKERKGCLLPPSTTKEDCELRRFALTAVLASLRREKLTPPQECHSL